MYTEITNDYSFATPYIAPGETILWRGRPEPGHLFGSQDILLIPFSIFWCGFAIFWEVSAILSGAPFFFALWGIPFVCMGLYLVFGRFFHIAWLRKNTFYVITNQKVLRKRGKKIDMLEARTMPSIHVTAHTDGRGTIRFGEMVYHRGRRNSSWGPDNSQFMLDNIPDVARVQQILHTIARARES